MELLMGGEVDRHLWDSSTGLSLYLIKPSFVLPRVASSRRA